MTDQRHVKASVDESGDLVWYGHDLGPSVGFLQSGANEYEFWRTVRAAHVPALVAALGGQPGTTRPDWSTRDSTRMSP